MIEPVPGLRLFPGMLDRAAQESLLAAVREVVRAAPLFTPRMPRSGKPFSVAMTNCGPLGWVSGRDGYRYQPVHPETGKPWPPIPAGLTAIWQTVAGCPGLPQACLVNHYAPQARMGLHVDRDERDFTAPVVSVSLGDTCVFRYGGTERKDPTRSLKLNSGDVLVIGGAARPIHHGVDRIISGTSTLLSQPGRINLTLRRVDPVDE
ncbi:MAG: alpha-ketoglutarate-dependent dioxygenase AlkB [Rhodobiaceae bacterium]|nr:alpha-ketoglutarate-dependent dioxygenase AlkB [Rhodobiaceae bacterium]